MPNQGDPALSARRLEQEWEREGETDGTGVWRSASVLASFSHSRERTGFPSGYGNAFGLRVSPLSFWRATPETLSGRGVFEIGGQEVSFQLI